MHVDYNRNTRQEKKSISHFGDTFSSASRAVKEEAVMGNRGEEKLETNNA